LHDGHFVLSVTTIVFLEGAVAADGTLSATGSAPDGRPVNFGGRIDGSVLRAGSYNGNCAYAFSLIRSS
jgi:hypothetical protein